MKESVPRHDRDDRTTPQEELGGLAHAPDIHEATAMGKAGLGGVGVARTLTRPKRGHLDRNGNTHEMSELTEEQRMRAHQGYLLATETLKAIRRSRVNPGPTS